MYSIYLKSWWGKLSLILPALLLAAASVSAQTNVRGKVSDNTNAPLPGVSVKVKNSSTGVITDASGNYSISVPDNATLLFSYVGFVSQEVALNGRSSVNVTLVEDS